MQQMQVQGWKLGSSANYQRKTALYEQDALDFVQITQPDEY